MAGLPWSTPLYRREVSQSRGTNPPCRGASDDALGQKKKSAHIIQKINDNFLSASSPSLSVAHSLALQHGGYVPREWPAVKGLLYLFFRGLRSDHLRILIYVNLSKLIFDILHQDQVPSTDEQSWQRSRISSHRLTHKLRDSQGTRKYWMIITTSCTCVNCWMIIQKMQILDDNHKGTCKYWMIITTSCRGVNC